MPKIFAIPTKLVLNLPDNQIKFLIFLIWPQYMQNALNMSDKIVTGAEIYCQKMGNRK